MAADTDLLDVNLTFDFQGGTRAWHWDVVQPGAAFVETDPFDRAMLATMSRLTLSATLARTTFDPVFQGDRFRNFVATTAMISASQSTFPPPLAVFAQGDFSRPTPEPGSLALIAGGATAAAIRYRRVLRRRRIRA